MFVWLCNCLLIVLLSGALIKYSLLLTFTNYSAEESRFSEMKQLGLAAGSGISRDNRGKLGSFKRKAFIGLSLLSIHESKTTKTYTEKYRWRYCVMIDWFLMIFIWEFAFHVTGFFTVAVSLFLAEAINRLEAETPAERLCRGASCLRILVCPPSIGGRPLPLCLSFVWLFWLPPACSAGRLC